MQAWTEKTVNGVKLRYGNEGLVAKNAADVPRVLKEHGVAVLFNVLNKKECQAMRDGAWKTAQTLLPDLERDDSSTYKEMSKLRPHHGGLIQWHGWAHSQYVWDVRTNTQVIAPFKHIYGTKADDLRVSFDGINFGLGYKEFDGHWKLHIDQDFKPGKAGVFCCVQSWVTSEPVDVGDATLRCYPGSHKLHGDFSRHFHLGDSRSRKSDWFQLSRGPIRTKYIKWYTDTHGMIDTCITCPAGSMVFWDSRTVHSGIERLPMPEIPNTERNMRNLSYVCYLPAEKCQDRVQMRKDAFNPKSELFMRTFSHWPNEMRPFDQFPPERRDGYRVPDSQLAEKWQWLPKLPPPVFKSDFELRVAGLLDGEKTSP